MGKAEFSAALRGIEPWLFAYYQDRAREEAKGRQEASGIRSEGRGEVRARGRERRSAQRGARSTLGGFLLKTPLERRSAARPTGPSSLGGDLRLASPVAARALAGKPEFVDFPLGEKLPLVQDLLAGEGPLGDGTLPRDVRVKRAAPKPLTEFQKQSLEIRKKRDKATADLRKDAKDKKIPPGVSANLALANGFDADAREFRVQQEKLVDAGDDAGAEAMGLRAQQAGRRAGAHREGVKRLLVGQPANVSDWVIVNTTVETKGIFGGKKTKTKREVVEKPAQAPRRKGSRDSLGLFGKPRR